MFFKRAIIKFCLFMDSINFTPSTQDSWFAKAVVLDDKWETNLVDRTYWEAK